MKTVFTISILLLIFAIPTWGQGGAKAYFPDVEVVDQNGKAHRFYSDLMDGKVVIINAFHTSCKSSVPVMTRTLAKIQQNLGARSRDVNFLSISVDPTDDPAKTKPLAESFKVGPGWYFLTGKKPNMDQVLKKLGLDVANPEDHSTIFIIGNLKTGLWKKVLGLANVDDIQAVVEDVIKG